MKMFKTYNNTKKWAVCVDGKYGLVETEKEADVLWELVMKNEYHFDNTPFGSFQIIAPMTEPTATHTIPLSDFTAINIEQYILDAHNRPSPALPSFDWSGLIDDDTFTRCFK